MKMLFRDWPQVRIPAVTRGRLLVLLFAMVNALTPVSAQHGHAPWYSVRVERQPTLTVITFAIDDGAMRVNLPRTIVGGQRFFGTVTDERGFGQVTAYSLEFADQIAPQTSMFSWVAPNVEATTDVPLIFSDFTGKELARTDVSVTIPDKSSAKLPGFPRAIQSGHPVPYSGSFDGFGWNTTVIIAGQKVPHTVADVG